MAATKKKTMARKTSKTELANLQQQIAEEAAGISDSVGATTGNKIRTTNAKEFVLPDGNKSQGPLRCVILDFNSHNNFYEGAFDPEKIAAPVCFAVSKPASLKGRIKNLIPSDSSTAKMDDGVGCDECPMNQFGTDERGRGKACKNIRRLAVVEEGAALDAPIMILDVSPSALGRFDGFVKKLAVKHTTPITVVTEIAFDAQATYASLTFQEVTPNVALAEHWARKSEAQQLLVQEPDTTPREVATKAKVSKKKVVKRRARKAA